jgi:hypothetical protein
LATPWTYHFNIALAAIYGLTPGLLIGRLSQGAQDIAKSKKDLLSSGSSTQQS